MKKSKSIQFVIDDFQDIYNTIKSISLYQYTSSSLFRDPKIELNQEAENIYNHIKKFESENNLHNYLTVNLISIMENYLQNILIEVIEKENDKSLNLLKNTDLKRILLHKT